MRVLTHLDSPLFAGHLETLSELVVRHYAEAWQFGFDSIRHGSEQLIAQLVGRLDEPALSRKHGNRFNNSYWALPTHPSLDFRWLLQLGNVLSPCCAISYTVWGAKTACNRMCRGWRSCGRRKIRRGLKNENGYEELCKESDHGGR